MDLNHLSHYYNHRIRENTTSLEKIKKRIHLWGTIRLAMVVSALFFLYRFWNTGTLPVLAIVLSFLIPFLWIVWNHNRLFLKKRYLQTSVASDQNELKALNNDFSAFDGASEKIDVNHAFTLDLDVFGENSLFQSLNRTATIRGKEILSDWFNHPLESASQIQERQEAIRELSSQPELIHHFRVTGLLHPGQISDDKELDTFAQAPLLFNNHRFWQCLSYAIPVLWIVFILLTSWGWLPGSLLTWVYLLFLMISESQVKKVNKLLAVTGSKMRTFSTYSDLIEIVEKNEAKAGILNEIKQNFHFRGRQASAAIKKLSRLLGDLDQRSNFLVHLIFNPLILWDIRKSIAIERWKEENKHNFVRWINILGKFDALCSLSVFDYNHPSFVYPEITTDYFVLEGKALAHPLMDKEVCVQNDVNISSVPYFMIVTGANMAGKSTYLRTIGANYLLACIGAPVCASSFRVYPAGLITSLRTSDSLIQNESYFFAELKRLKRIIEDLESGQERFILLDEILKGTNSVDKQKGSLALIQQLIRLNACGIIATHDLILGDLEQKYPEHVRNFCFEADIEGDRLSFSYKMKTGIAQNMNACFLMQKMGITL